jgi:hypothetical protein
MDSEDFSYYRRGTEEEGGAREEDDVPKLRRPKPSNS